MGLILIIIAFIILTIIANARLCVSWHELLWGIVLGIGILGSTISFSILIGIGVTNRWAEQINLKRYEEIVTLATTKPTTFQQAYIIQKQVDELNQKLYESKTLDQYSDLMVGIYKCKEFSQKPFIEFDWHPNE